MASPRPTTLKLPSAQQPVVEAIDEGFGETRLGDAGEIENRAAVRLQAVEGKGASLPKFHKVTG